MAVFVVVHVRALTFSRCSEQDDPVVAAFKGLNLKDTNQFKAFGQTLATKLLTHSAEDVADFLKAVTEQVSCKFASTNRV